MTPTHPDCPTQWHAFRLTEPLVVIGMIGVRPAILLRVISAARRPARATQCASNLRQRATSLIAFSNSYRGSSPPDSPEMNQLWRQEPILGRYGSPPLCMSNDTLAGAILVCPSDADDAARSDAINAFASSYDSSFVRDDPGYTFS